ncbi:hypothetical protein GY12_01915 [Micrococcus luteus]|nr:hypothetical protein GY12_01915 [Micrococcus luteus]
MLATGGTLIEAIRFLYQRGAARVTCLCLLGAPEGIERLEASLGDVEVDLYLAAVDERLDERSYIVRPRARATGSTVWRNDLKGPPRPPRDDHRPPAPPGGRGRLTGASPAGTSSGAANVSSI